VSIIYQKPALTYAFSVFIDAFGEFSESLLVIIIVVL